MEDAVQEEMRPLKFDFSQPAEKGYLRSFIPNLLLHISRYYPDLGWREIGKHDMHAFVSLGGGFGAKYCIYSDSKPLGVCNFGFDDVDGDLEYVYFKFNDTSNVLPNERGKELRASISCNRARRYDTYPEIPFP